jgi:uncharacterized protein YndB with AHSA1/START domain
MQRTITHGTFTIERTFNAPLPKVWNAFADQTAKEKWFKGPDSSPDEHTMDFRVGGAEHNRGKFHDGSEHSFEATYYDIVPEARIVYAYEMHIDGKRISVSLATMEFTAYEGKTLFVIHEDGAFLDSFDKPEERERGTRELLNALAASVE